MPRVKKEAENFLARSQLMSTGCWKNTVKYLVECARQDIIWACGIRLTEAERFDISKWRGQNILGFALMEVREALRNCIREKMND